MDSETLSAGQIDDLKETYTYERHSPGFVEVPGETVWALLSMASRTLAAEQKQADLQQQVISAQKQAQEAVQGRVEAVERAQRAEAEVDVWKRRANRVLEKFAPVQLKSASLRVDICTCTLPAIGVAILDPACLVHGAEGQFVESGE